MKNPKRKDKDVAREMLHKVGQDVAAELREQELMTPARIALAYRRVFNGEDGEIVLADLKAKFNGTVVRIRPAGIDPYEVVYREGQRDIWLHLVEMKQPPAPVTPTEETDS